MQKLLMIVGGLALAGVATYVLLDRSAAEKPTDKPADKRIDKPTEKPTEKPADKPDNRPGDRPVPPVPATEDPIESLARAILADGEARAFEKIHADASEEFRIRNSLEELRPRFLVPRAALGRPTAIGKVTVGKIDPGSDGGPTVKVSMDLAYERGPVRAELLLVQQEGRWKLHDLALDFDPGRVPRPDPSSLEKRSRDLLALYDARSYGDLYATFPSSLKTFWKTDGSEPRLPPLREQLGKVVEAKLVPAPARDDEGHEVEVRLGVTFEHGVGEASFGWMWEWAAGDEDWHLVGFDIKPSVR